MVALQLIQMHQKRELEKHQRGIMSHNLCAWAAVIMKVFVYVFRCKERGLSITKYAIHTQVDKCDCINTIPVSAYVIMCSFNCTYNINAVYLNQGMNSPLLSMLDWNHLCMQNWKLTITVAILKIAIQVSMFMRSQINISSELVFTLNTLICNPFPFM